MTFNTVRQIALALPDVEEGTTYGTAAFKLRGELLTCRAIHRSAERNSVAVRVSFDQRDDLIASDPEIYYLTNHYVNYPVVLVRMSRIHPDALRDLLATSWRFVNAKARAAKRPRRTQI